MASLAASGVEVDRNAMTEEEREMFDDLLEAIATNHDRVVGKVQEPFQTSLAGDSPATADVGGDAATDDGPAETAPADATSAEGAAVDDSSGGDDGGRPAGEAAASADPGTADVGGAVAAHGRTDDADGDGSGEGGDAETAATDGASEADGDEPPDGFVRVRVLEEIPGFVGTDGVEYAPDPDDVVTVPEQNADALVGRDAAEPLDEG